MQVIKTKLANKYGAFSTKHGFYRLEIKDGFVSLIDATCPHRGGPLFFGCATNGKIQCPWHKNEYHEYTIKSRSRPIIKNGESIFIFLEDKIERFLNINNEVLCATE